MKLALLGIDRYVHSLAAAVLRDQRHEVTVVCDSPEREGDVLQLHPAAHREGDWENLLLGRNFDLLVVGANPQNGELRYEQLRRLVQEAIPLVVVQPAAEAIALHELAMIQNDTGSLLAAWNPLLGDTAIGLINEHLRGSEAAHISHVSIQRSISERTWQAIKMQLARDAQWVSQLIGPPDRVTALAPNTGGDELSSLAVTFVGKGNALAQWTLGAATGMNAVTVAGNFGTAEWQTQMDGSSELAIDGPSGREERAWTSEEHQAEVGRNFLSFLESTLEAQKQRDSFELATRAVELAEAAQESNRRNRTISMHYEEHSEQQTFKSVMAAGGCLLLLGLLLTCVASVALDSIGAPLRNNPWWRIWPVYVFAPVVAFLLLQSLWRVFATPRRP